MSTLNSIPYHHPLLPPFSLTCNARTTLLELVVVVVYTWCSKIAAAAGRSVSSLLFGKCLLLCIQNTHTRMCVMHFETADYTHWYVYTWNAGSFVFFPYVNVYSLSLSCCAIAFAVSRSLSLNWFSLLLLISSPSIVKGPSPDQRDCVTLTKLEEQTQRERERWNWNKTANTIKKGNDGKFLEMIFFIWRRKNFGLSTAQSGVIQCRKRLSWRVTQ